MIFVNEINELQKNSMHKLHYWKNYIIESCTILKWRALEIIQEIYYIVGSYTTLYKKFEIILKWDEWKS